MFLYFIVILFLTLSGFIYRINGFPVIKNRVSHHYQRWKRLNSLVSVTENNNLRIAWYSAQILFKALYITFLQYMNTTIKRIDAKTYELTYVVNGSLYKMLIVPKRGPKPIIMVYNENEEDVTDEVLTYMGPQYDWHHSKISPKFFGYQSLTFELADGTEHTYDGTSHVDHEKIN